MRGIIALSRYKKQKDTKRNHFHVTNSQNVEDDARTNECASQSKEIDDRIAAMNFGKSAGIARETQGNMSRKLKVMLLNEQQQSGIALGSCLFETLIISA